MFTKILVVDSFNRSNNDGNPGDYNSKLSQNIDNVTKVKLLETNILSIHLTDFINTLTLYEEDGTKTIIRIDSGKYNLKELITRLRMNAKPKFHIEYSQEKSRVIISSNKKFKVSVEGLARYLGFINHIDGFSNKVTSTIEPYINNSYYFLRLGSIPSNIVYNKRGTDGYTFFISDNNTEQSIILSQPITISDLYVTVYDHLGRLVQLKKNWYFKLELTCEEKIQDSCDFSIIQSILDKEDLK